MTKYNVALTLNNAIVNNHPCAGSTCDDIVLVVRNKIRKIQKDSNDAEKRSIEQSSRQTEGCV